MNELTKNLAFGYNFAERSIDKLMEVLPSVLGFILFIICAFLFYRLIVFIVSKIVKRLNMEALVEKHFSSAKSLKVKFSPSSVIIVFVKFTLVLGLTILGSEILGLTILSQQLGQILGYLPKVIIAMLLILIGLYLSTAARKIVFSLFDSFEISGAKLISRIVSIVIIFFITLIAIELIGIDTSIITNNLSIILGACMVCIAIALGLGSVEIVKRILFGFYFKKNFRIGQHISFQEIQGTITRMDNISIVLDVQNGQLVIPIRDLVDTQIMVVSKP